MGYTPPDSPNLIQFNMTANQNLCDEIVKRLVDNAVFTTKEVLTSDEASKYMGVSKSYLYKLTMRKEIPHYKPLGKMCYFQRAELEEWLQRNRVATDEELSAKATNYCMKGGAVCAR